VKKEIFIKGRKEKKVLKMMNSMTLPRWFGRRRKTGDKKGHQGPMIANLDSSQLSLSRPNVKKDSGIKVFNKGWLSPKRTSKSTCDLPSSTSSAAAPTPPLATSEETWRVHKSAIHTEKSGSELFLPHVGTPHWNNPTHDDVINAKRNLRKSLSSNTLPTSSNIYENISDEPNYQNFPTKQQQQQRYSFATSSNVRYDDEVSRRFGSGAQLSILDEADEPASIDRLDMLRASKKLFASQRDILLRQTSSLSNGSFAKQSSVDQNDDSFQGTSTFVVSI